MDAPGGTGKTYLLNCILSAVRSDSHIAIATALSAVASKLLAGPAMLVEPLSTATSKYLSKSGRTPCAPSPMQWPN